MYVNPRGCVLSSRVGSASLLVGVILIGAAAMLAATSASAEDVAASALPALSTGFLVWSLSGAFGLLVGMFASRRAIRAATRSASADPARPAGHAGAASADRYHTALETVEESA